jgi:hypothetical protein
MSNTFKTINELAQYSAVFLDSKLGLANRVSRQAQSVYANGRGDTVRVPIRTPMTTADEYVAGSGTVTSSNITETSADITLNRHFYKSATLTAQNKTLDIKNFADQVLFPLVQSVAQGIDTMVAREMRLFSRNLVGTAGTTPSTVAHCTAGVLKLMDNKVNADEGYMAAITPASWAGLMGAVEMKSNDYGSSQNGGMAVGQLSPVSGIREFFTTQNLGTFSSGDTAGTVLIKGASQTGTSIIIDGFTSATGTVKQGTRLTFAGDTQVYTVQADATIASNETTISIYPSKASASANDGAVTFETAFKESYIYHPSSIACAVVAPAPFDDNTSSVVQVNGLSLRVSYQKSGLDEIVVVDTLAGVKLIHAEGGCVFQG